MRPNNNILLNLIMCAVFVVAAQHIKAQGWERLYGTTQADDPQQVIQTRDGGFLMVGYVTESSGTKQDIHLIKTDAEGNQQWLRNYGRTGMNERAYTAVQNPDGSYIIGGVSDNDTLGFDGQAYLLKINALGDTIWSRTFFQNYCNDVFYYLLRLRNGSGYLAVGTRCNPATPGVRDDVSLVKVDLNGNPIWTRSYGDTAFFEFPKAVVEAADGSFFIGGVRGLYGFTNQSSFIFKTDNNGNRLWVHTFGNSTLHECTGLVVNTEGGVWAAGGYSTNATTGTSYLKKLAANGTVQWTKDYDGLHWAVSLTRRLNNDFALVSGNVGGRQHNELLLTDSAGVVLSRTKIQGYSPKDDLKSVMSTSDGGFALLSERTIDNKQFYLRKTDASGAVFTNNVNGKIFYDKNNNCRFDPSVDAPLVNWLIKAENANTTLWSYTDSLGNYSIYADSQNYQLSLIKPNNYWSACKDSVIFGLNSTVPSIRIDFAVKNQIACPLLEVDITTPLLRRCFDNNYTIRYCNRGTVAAQNAIVRIKLDNGLLYNSATRPLSSRQGNTLFFNLGNIEQGGCGTFVVNVTVRCDSTFIGQTHCTEARIFPDSLCLPQTNWLGGNIAVAGTCAGDSVEFRITNTGRGATTTPIKHIVIEDCVVFLQGQVPTLSPNQSQLVKVPANGATWRIISEQEANHPNPDSRPTAAVEGCRARLNMPLRLGFVTEFDEDDGDPFTAIDCHSNIGSYDPNDKQTHPKGVENQHFITEKEELDYTIRFQNTGTDTAFTVVIKDTLSAHLDITTLRIGASSHTYKVDILEGKILKLTFNNINLPDSNRNLAASQGFIKFWVRLKKNTPFGVKIENRAAIYFDYNAPILTNTTFHTLKKTEKYQTNEVTVCAGTAYKDIVYTVPTKRLDTVRFARFDSIYLTHINVLATLWRLKDTPILRGGIFRGITVQRDTTIAVRHKATNGCDSIVSYRFKVLTSIDNELSQNIRVYPNPTTNFFTIELSHFSPSQANWVLTIVDAYGRVNVRQNLRDIKTFINTTLPKGIYFWSIRYGTRLVGCGKVVLTE